MSLVTVLAVAGFAAAVGGLVQSGVGLGVGLVTAPVLTLLDPALMPGTLLVAGTCLPLAILAREVRHADWRGVSWALAGRLAGTAAGVWVVAAVPLRALGLFIGGAVLAVVILTSLGASLPRNGATLLAAGTVSGVSGTATSIGGPPVALLYQHESGPRVRATLSVFLFTGNLLALVALAVSGHLPGRDIPAGLVLLACAGAGFAAAAGLRRYLDGGRIRAAVLVVTTASALALIVRSIVG
jgi:uncharacterized membrane protein YfcA